MRKRNLSILTAVSFAFMLASLAYWIHGYFAYDITGYYHTTWPTNEHLIMKDYSITLRQGQFRVELAGCDWDLSEMTKLHAGRLILSDQHNVAPPLSSWLTFTGPLDSSSATEIISQSLIGFRKDPVCGPSWTGDTITFPAWLPTLLLALLPARRFSRRRRKSSPPNAAPAGLALA